MGKNEIVLFESKDGKVSLPVKIDTDTVWLTQVQIAQLFGKDRTVVGRHIRNAISDGEIVPATMCAKIAHLADNAAGSVKIEIYNLEVIIAVGYRVHSPRGVEFRRWATSVLKEYIVRGYVVNQERMRHALTVMIAESKPQEKELMVNLVMTFLK